MTRRTLILSLVATLTVLLVDSAARPRKEVGGGEDWLSWTPVQRNAYVYGFLDGYLKGRAMACDVANQLFEVGKPHRLGNGHDPEDMPSARCLARMADYSKFKLEETGVDVSAYTTVITEFYTKRPEYRGLPITYLMESLSDSKYKTADQLFQAARNGEIRTNW